MIKARMVQGRISRHKVMLYTISTCIWCRRLKDKLNSRDIQYSYIDIDLIPYMQKEVLKAKLREVKPRLAFPMMFVNEEFIPNIEIDKKIEELVRDV
ncbi:MAG: glutaredoxin family protein [Promethearchaeota archaeon]